MEKRAMSVKRETKPQEPKRLSKIGEWRRTNPNGTATILDMRAVMR